MPSSARAADEEDLIVKSKEVRGAAGQGGEENDHDCGGASGGGH